MVNQTEKNQPIELSELAQLEDIDEIAIQERLDEIQTLIGNKSIIVRREVDKVEFYVSKETEIKKAQNVKLIVFLLGVYSDVCKEGNREIFLDMVPEESKKIVKRILKMATKHTVFKTIFYRTTRPWGYLTSPIRKRKLIIDEDSVPLSTEFYEITFERLTEDENVDRFKVEMDKIELETLIEELQEILGEEE